MPTDALIALQPLITKTASFQGAGLQLVAGSTRWPFVARVIYSNASANTTGDTVTFTLDVCKDGTNVNFNTEFQSDPIALPTTATSGEIQIPFSVSPSSVANGVFVRLSVSFSSTAHADTITYIGDFMIARP